MKIAFLTVAIFLTFGCSRKAQAPSVKPDSAPVAQANPAPPADAMSTDDMLRCDRRSILFDPSKQPKPKPVNEVKAADLVPGQTAWVNTLVSNKGKLYVNKFNTIKGDSEESYTVMVRRVTGGFLADCDSPELWIFLNDAAESPSPIEALIPVVGHIDVKPRRKPEDSDFPTIFRELHIQNQ